MCQVKSEISSNMHPFGMLDRDQRTILTCNVAKLNKNQFSSSLSPSSSSSTTAAASINPVDKQIDAIYCNCRRQPIDCTLSWIYCACALLQSRLTDKPISTAPNSHPSGCITTKNIVHTCTGTSHFCQTTKNTVHLINHHHQNTQYCNKQQTRRQHHHSTNKISIKMQHKTCGYNGKSKVSDYFVLFLCLWTLSVHRAIAYPAHQAFANSTPKMALDKLQEKLQSPCGGNNVITPQRDTTKSDVVDLLRIIKEQAGVAKTQADKDIIDYLVVKAVYSVEEYHETWKLMNEAWLYPQGKELHKQFNESIPTTIHNHFSTFNFENILQLLHDCDERFQLLLIGFHNVIEDHKSKIQTMDREKFDPLKQIFGRAQNGTQKVLCEIRTALKKFGRTVKIIKPHEITNSGKVGTFYDWVIFREYINQLEHLHAVLNVIISTGEMHHTV